VLDQITYGAFGNILSQTNSSNAPRYLYAGGEWDANLGLYHFGARWDDPVNGRWISQDPLGLAPDPNPYRYVGNGPTDSVDPTGMQTSQGSGNNRWNRQSFPYASDGYFDTYRWILDGNQARLEIWLGGQWYRVARDGFHGSNTRPVAGRPGWLWDYSRGGQPVLVPGGRWVSPRPPPIITTVPAQPVTPPLLRTIVEAGRIFIYLPNGRRIQVGIMAGGPRFPTPNPFGIPPPPGVPIYDPSRLPLIFPGPGGYIDY
jgi:RHS repeat-associated protein